MVKRYFLPFILGSIFIWGLLLGSVYLKNKHEVSLTLIFPSSQSDTRLKLLSIGEMSTNNRSIFSNIKIDPKETYKEIIMSNNLRFAISQSLKIPLSQVPSPKIKSIPQTPLIKISMKSDSENNLLIMLESLLVNLKKAINEHRINYIRSRSETNSKQLNASKLKIDILSENIRNIRLNYDLLGRRADDYYIKQIYDLQDIMRKKKIEVITLKTQLEQFEKVLKVTPEEASLALLINSDYILQELYRQRADTLSKLSELSVSSGMNNPDYLRENRKYKVLTNQINARLFSLEKGIDDQSTKHLILNVNIDERSEIFKMYILNKVKYETVMSEFNQYDIEIKELKVFAEEVLSKYNELQMLTKKLELQEAIYFSKLGNEQAYIDDAESIYPDIQIWESAKVIREKSKTMYLIVILVAIISTMLWVLILCIYHKKQNLKIQMKK